ncbi:MAG: hypothetical protein ACRDC4_09325, partial [Plesiomonas sp.]
MAKIPQTRSNSGSKIKYEVLADGDYPARIVRFIGLGVQEQPEWQGQKKDPAFKCSIQFELIGMDTVGTKEDGTKTDPAPACQFKDYFLFPGAKRGGVFDLCQIIDPSIQSVPGDLDWFINNLDAIVNVRVGHYVTKTGEKRNKVSGVSAIPSMFKSQIGASRSDKVGFDPYVDSPDMMQAYSKLYKFQRDMLTEAHDSQHIVFAGKEPIKQGDAGAPQAPAQTQTTPYQTQTGASQDNPAAMDFD